MGNDAKKTELVPGTLEMLILKTLERNAEPMHGYGIARYIKQISGDALQAEKQMILWAHQRWKVEQGYQHMKEELGLDHFEGRSWRGLHHRVTLCFMAYCFLTLIRYRKKSQLDLTRNQKVA